MKNMPPMDVAEFRYGSTSTVKNENDLKTGGACGRQNMLWQELLECLLSKSKLNAKII